MCMYGNYFLVLRLGKVVNILGILFKDSDFCKI